MVLFVTLGTDGDGSFVAVAAAAAAITAAATSSGGLVLFVALDGFDALLGLKGSSLCCKYLVTRSAKVAVEPAEGGGEVLGVVQEDLAVAWSGGLEDHCCSAGGEGVGEGRLDQSGDVVAVVFINLSGLLADCSLLLGRRCWRPTCGPCSSLLTVTLVSGEASMTSSMATTV
jgi:hypothetical protein